MIPSCSLLATLLFVQPGVLLAISTLRAHCWLTCSWLPAMTLRVFSTELFSSQLVARICDCRGSSFPGVGLSICPTVLNCVVFLFGLFLGPT